MEAEEEEGGNLQVEEATSRLKMGLHVGPARYQPASPRYIRAEEEEEDEDVEAPYLAPRDNSRAKTYPEDGPLLASSESIPDLIDLDEEEPPCQQPAPTRSGSAVCPATHALSKKVTVSPMENPLPSPFSDKEKLEGRCPLRQLRMDQ